MWELRSTDGQPITLTFESFDLDPDTSYDGYCFDHVQIYDGISTQRFCGDSIPGPFTSIGTTMRVYFETSTLRTSRGFLASVCCSVDVTTDDTGKRQETFHRLQITDYKILHFQTQHRAFIRHHLKATLRIIIVGI